VAAFPKASYNRMYDPMYGPLWTLEGGLAPEEDGDHYLPDRDFFEWWYFDASFDNGFRLVAILHSSLFNAVDHKPTVDIRLTPPGQASILAIGRYPRSQYKASSQHCEIQIAGCKAAATGSSQYRLQLRQGEVEADLVYEILVPGWKPGNGNLFFDEKSGTYFKWVVPIPLAHVSGSLSIAGKRTTVQGMGYHDHNWGNFLLADAFSHWIWGRILGEVEGETFSVVFGDVYGRGDPLLNVRPLMLVERGKIREENPVISISTKNAMQDTNTSLSYPSQILMKAHSSGFDLRVDLQSKHVLEKVDFASPYFRRSLPRQLSEIAFYSSVGKPVIGRLLPALLGRGAYLRIAADAQLKICGNGEAYLQAEAIYEIMQLGRI
jgi:hypothetical protein